MAVPFQIPRMKLGSLPDWYEHKRSKSAFMRVYWVTVLVNLILLGLIAFEVINTQAFMVEI
ncbi:hypothetical protein F0261_05565 [Alteromonas sp. 07-89-2]|uniref:hypothetical protein n=1 Tax=Alteromonas sp. 07-89-2 TaxID=2607609 RepID=UPI00148B6330|nr:hypothetical protein [Alteromonas sp. 07-89-2]NOH57505.1 hypothetical protein [Alteromonas sp. 07-89-2]